MKYLKKFENNNEIEIGDYIICSYNRNNTSSTNIKNLGNFISNAIGIVIGYNKDNGLEIKYNNVPDNIKLFFNGENLNIRRGTDIKSVLAFGKTIEELKIKLEANKYNL